MHRRGIRQAGVQIRHHACQCGAGPVHVRAPSGDASDQQRVGTYAAQGGDTPQDTPEAGDPGGHEDVRRPDDMRHDMAQAEGRPDGEPARRARGSLTSYVCVVDVVVSVVLKVHQRVAAVVLHAAARFHVDWSWMYRDGRGMRCTSATVVW